MKEKAARNKTLILSPEQETAYAKKALTLGGYARAEELKNQIIWQDSFEALDFIAENSVDLLVVDPPYNLTKKYADTTFKERDFDEYCLWLDSWLKKTVAILKPSASVYICSDWRTSMAIPLVAQKYFILRNRISWEREKGRACAKNWKNCLEDIWFFTKSNDYTFNLDSVKMQRQVIAPYKKKNGEPKDWNEKGGKKLRLTAPSNFWSDITIPFWSMPENTEHPTQKPEKLLAKLILASSNEGDLIFDPFVGSGTTAVVAKKLKRSYLGIEREKKYVALALKRLELADENKQIQGYKDGVFKLRNC